MVNTVKVTSCPENFHLKSAFPDGWCRKNAKAGLAGFVSKLRGVQSLFGYAKRF
jgi:hypothetical protein